VSLIRDKRHRMSDRMLLSRSPSQRGAHFALLCKVAHPRDWRALRFQSIEQELPAALPISHVSPSLSLSLSPDASGVCQSSVREHSGVTGTRCMTGNRKTSIGHGSPARRDQYIPALRGEINPYMLLHCPLLHLQCHADYCSTKIYLILNFCSASGDARSQCHVFAWFWRSFWPCSHSRHPIATSRRTTYASLLRRVHRTFAFSSSVLERSGDLQKPASRERSAIQAEIRRQIASAAAAHATSPACDCHATDSPQGSN